jgi:hypothetical protein
MGGPVREVTAPLAEQAAAGTLTVDVSTVLPLEQAADGLATIANGRRAARSSSRSATHHQAGSRRSTRPWSWSSKRSMQSLAV